MEGQDYTNFLVMRVAPDTNKEPAAEADSMEDNSSSNIYDNILPPGAQGQDREKSTEEARTGDDSEQKRGPKQNIGFLVHQRAGCLRGVKRTIARLCPLLVILFLMWLLFLTLMLVKYEKISEKLKAADRDRSAMNVYMSEMREELRTQRVDFVEKQVIVSRGLDDAKKDHEEIKARLDKDLAALRADLESITKCPEGWKSHKTSCYYFSPKHQPWEAAKQFCQQQNSHLVVVNDQQEQEFLAQNLKGHWIGLSDSVTEGDWRWVNGLPIGVSFWREGEPNNAGDEDCAVTENSKWNDIHCSHQSQWVCEKGLF